MARQRQDDPQRRRPESAGDRAAATANGHQMLLLPSHQPQVPALLVVPADQILLAPCHLAQRLRTGCSRGGQAYNEKRSLGTCQLVSALPVPRPAPCQEVQKEDLRWRARARSHRMLCVGHSAAAWLPLLANPAAT